MANENANAVERLKKEHAENAKHNKLGNEPAGKSSGRSRSKSIKRTDKVAPSGVMSGFSKLPIGFGIKAKNGSMFGVEAQITDRVYIVRRRQDDRLFSMKIEWIGGVTDPKQLKRDVFVLLDAAKHQKRFTRHFLKLITKGRVAGQFNYLIQTLADYNLDEVRTIVLEGCDFSPKNAARLAMQSYQAVHDCHSLGFCHRDLSPTKFVMGLENPHLIYLIGFSLSYHFEQRYDTKVSKDSPRKLPKRVNRTFLPRAYHRNKNIYRRDDMESWIYLCFNLFGRKILPWNESFNDLNMFVNKERLFCGEFEEAYKYVPIPFKTIVHYLDKLGDTERPDYTFIGMNLVRIKEDLKFKFYGPFDWQKAQAQDQEEKEGDGIELDNEHKDEKKGDDKEDKAEKKEDGKEATPSDKKDKKKGKDEEFSEKSG